MTWQGLHTPLQREAALIAPYAMSSDDSRGRRHPEPPHPYRGPYQRDRDRIVHCAAYRRLSGKTQVFTAVSDYHRTRLTHTLEVSSLARTLARALRLNEDLVEALAQIHDLGHPPYGHAGEETLDACATNHGGFSHNRYALTLVEEIEERFHTFCGLNLSMEVLEGQLARAEKDSSHVPLLETQVVDAADSAAYDPHDIDDSIQLGLVPLDEVLAIPLVRDAATAVRERYANLNQEMLRKAVVHYLLDMQVTDILKTTAARLADRQPQSADEARELGVMVAPSDEFNERKTELQQFLRERIYRHEKVMAVRERGQRQLQEMFDGYLRRPDRLTRRFQRRSQKVGLPRAICDYLAGMTDGYCEQEWGRLKSET